MDGKNFIAANNIGKPLTLQFTAVDGREVDLAKLKGKTILNVNIQDQQAQRLVTLMSTAKP